MDLSRPPLSLLWAFIGLSVGLFWLFFSVVFFAAPQSTFITVSEVIADISCPPLLLDFDNIFAAPFLNALLYGLLAFVIRRLRQRIRGNKSGDSSEQASIGDAADAVDPAPGENPGV